MLRNRLLLAAVFSGLALWLEGVSRRVWAATPIWSEPRTTFFELLTRDGLSLAAFEAHTLGLLRRRPGSRAGGAPLSR